MYNFQSLKILYVLNNAYTHTQFDSSTDLINYSDFSGIFEDPDSGVSGCGNVFSVWRNISVLFIIGCFCTATPLSLICTLPAYVMADNVSHFLMHMKMS